MATPWREEERRLLALALQGGVAGRRAYSALVEHYLPEVLPQALGIVRDEGTAEDVVQEAALNVWDHLNPEDPPRDFGALLSTAVLNGARNYVVSWWWRRRRDLRWMGQESADQRQARLAAGDAIPEAPVHVLPESIRLTPEEIVSQREYERIAREVLERVLSEQERRCLQLKYAQGLSYREIAEVMGITEREVQTLLQTARNRLRPHLITALGIEDPGDLD